MELTDECQADFIITGNTIDFTKKLEYEDEEYLEEAKQFYFDGDN